MCESGEPAVLLAFDDIGTALYLLKQHVIQQKEVHHLEAVRQGEVPKAI